MIKNLGYILLFLITAIILSCEREFHANIVDCDYCYSNKPDSGDLVIRLTINDTYKYVPITVFKGDVEDSIEIAFIDSVNEEKLYVFVELNEKYSVTAAYIGDNKTIIVLDADKIKTKYVTDECDENCYMIKDGYIDVTLKYEE